MNMLLALILGLTLALNGCFAKIYQLPAHPDKNTPVFAPLADQETLVGVAVSGGGSRAATFAAGVMEALADVRIMREGKECSVLETVTHMSSVSGGSLATAYYAVKKPAKTEAVLAEQGLTPTYQQFFASFKADMQKDFELPALGRQLLYFRGANPTKNAYSFAEVWDADFFHGVTFSGLYDREKRGDAPQIIFNGTIYNTGRRLAMTTLPPSDFEYDFAGKLRDILKDKGQRFSKEGQASFDQRIERARNQFLPQTFEGIQGDHRDLPVSLAVATSASFPPVVGPVTYQAEGTKIFTHVGDGGLFDNLGTESLATLFLNKLSSNRPAVKKGLILVIDASFPFDEGTALNTKEKGFEVFKDDPSRIVGIMEERANAYQAMLWMSLRAERVLLPDYEHLTLITLRHTEAEWTDGDPIPAECPKTLTVETIKSTVRQVPTLFRIKDPCQAALLIASAHKVVAKQRDWIVRFLEKSP
jgi:predicted acylesterase/phospholipase RssA